MRPARPYFVQKKPVFGRRVETVSGETIGLLYMGFGRPAQYHITRSIQSMRRLGLEIPVAIVGDAHIPGRQTIPWTGQSPFDASQRRNFQFRAGRVKPFLYELSPFQRTLYLDADTEFRGDFTSGFEILDDHDMAVTEEMLTIGQLYNKAHAGWEINVIERDATLQELGGDRDIKFINSGVIFFRKSETTARTFAEWGRQWLRWQQWDEQLALMRALHNCGTKYTSLSVDWNHPHRAQAKIIWHNYGRAIVRVNVR